MTFEPIGIFHGQSKYPYEARRQAAADTSGAHGEVRLFAERGFEQALEDLAGFDRIWLIYQFHQNTAWKPKIMPPRGPRTKRGVFATRAPYRPNPIGLSAVSLVAVEGLRLIVAGSDLLEGTPILDVKPYLPYADAFPQSRVGWLEDIEAHRLTVTFEEFAQEQMNWLESRGVSQLRGFVQAQLEFDPTDAKRKRVVKSAAGYQLAYRTWRVFFKVNAKVIRVTELASGYSHEDLADASDPYGDKQVHREFASRCAGERLFS